MSVPTTMRASRRGRDWFGYDVAISGHTIFISAIGDDDAGDDSGTVYIFKYQNGSWVQVDELNAPQARGGEGFGSSLSLAGSMVVIGAPSANDDAGLAYLFVEDAGRWTLS